MDKNLESDEDSLVLPHSIGNMIKNSLTIMESEKETFHTDPELVTLHDSVNIARKYSKGFALQWDIIDEQSCEIFQTFIK